MSRLSDQLRSLGACRRDVEFAEPYESLSEAWGKCEVPSWKKWLIHRLGGPAWAEYERVTGPVWTEYERVRGPAWAEYERVRGQCLDSLLPQIEAELEAKFKGGHL